METQTDAPIKMQSDRIKLCGYFSVGFRADNAEWNYNLPSLVAPSLIATHGEQKPELSSETTPQLFKLCGSARKKIL